MMSKISSFFSFSEWSVISCCSIGKHCIWFTKSVSWSSRDAEISDTSENFLHSASALKWFYSVGFSTINFSYISFIFSCYRQSFVRFFTTLPVWRKFLCVLCDGQLRLGYIRTLEELLWSLSPRMISLYRSFLPLNYRQISDAPIGISSCCNWWSLMM